MSHIFFSQQLKSEKGKDCLLGQQGQEGQHLHLRVFRPGQKDAQHEQDKVSCRWGLDRQEEGRGRVLLFGSRIIIQHRVLWQIFRECVCDFYHANRRKTTDPASPPSPSAFTVLVLKKSAK